MNTNPQQVINNNQNRITNVMIRRRRRDLSSFHIQRLGELIGQNFRVMAPGAVQFLLDTYLRMLRNCRKDDPFCGREIKAISTNWMVLAMTMEYSVYYFSEVQIYIINLSKKEREAELAKSNISEERREKLLRKLQDYHKTKLRIKAFQRFFIEFIFGNVAPVVIFTTNLTVMIVSYATQKNISQNWLWIGLVPALGEICCGDPKLRNEVWRLITQGRIELQEYAGQSTDTSRSRCARFFDTIYLAFKEAVLVAFLLSASGVLNERFTKYNIPIIRYAFSVTLGVAIGGFLKAQFYPGHLPKSQVPFALQQYEIAKAIIFTVDFIINNSINLAAASDDYDLRFFKVLAFSFWLTTSFGRVGYFYWQYWINQLSEAQATVLQQQDDKSDDENLTKVQIVEPSQRVLKSKESGALIITTTEHIGEEEDNHNNQDTEAEEITADTEKQSLLGRQQKTYGTDAPLPSVQATSRSRFLSGNRGKPHIQETPEKRASNCLIV